MRSKDKEFLERTLFGLFEYLYTHFEHTAPNIASSDDNVSIDPQPLHLIFVNLSEYNFHYFNFRTMDFSITQFEFGQRPGVTLPSPEFLERLTEQGMRKLVSDHYDLLSQSEVKHLFPRIDEALDKAKQRSSDFFIQICGGHPYFNENRGKPLLAKRHAPFAITPQAREVWLKCYIQVLSKLDMPEDLIRSFWDYLNVFSSWMVNSREE